MLCCRRSSRVFHGFIFSALARRKISIFLIVSPFFSLSLNHNMKYFIYAALIPPLLVILFGLAAKWYFATYVRMEVIAPRIQPLPPSHLRTLYKASKLLCVGCTSGIGLAAATAACEAGAFVVVVGRRKPEEMLEVCKKPVEFVKGDLSVMRNVKTVTERIASYAFDTVLFTIGTVSSPKRKATEEGIEMDMAVSLLSRFVMARLLTSSKNQTLKAISPARKARIFIMGFSGGTAVPQLTDFNWEDKNTTFAPWKAHENTVIGNDALVEKLAKFHPSINVYGLNPGIIKTDILAPLLGGTKSYAAKAQELLLTHVCPSVEEYVNGTLKHLLGNLPCYLL